MDTLKLNNLRAANTDVIENGIVIEVDDDTRGDGRETSTAYLGTEQVRQLMDWLHEWMHIDWVTPENKGIRP